MTTTQPQRNVTLKRANSFTLLRFVDVGDVLLQALHGGEAFIAFVTFQ